MGARSLLVALALLTAWGATRARAQEPEEQVETPTAAQDTATQDTAVHDTVPAGPALGYQPPAVSLVITAGTPGGGDAQVQAVRAYRRTTAGEVLDSASLSRTVAIAGGLSGSVSGELGLGPRWVFRAGVGVATAKLETKYDGDDEAFVASVRAIGTGSADLLALSVESALRYRIPSIRKVRPYVELGIAASRWSADGDLPGLGLEDGIMRFEALVGAGGVVPLTRRLSLRILASTRVLRTPIHPVAGGDTVASSSALLVTALPPSSSLFADGARESLGLLRLQLGLSLDLGRPAAGRPDRGEPSDTTSSPDR